MASLSLQTDNATKEGDHPAAASHRLPDVTETPLLSGQTSRIFAPHNSTDPHYFGPRKVAIPRGRPVITPGRGRRVPRACESCRMRKTKCSGDAPVCRQCREQRAICIYPSSAREKAIKQNADLTKMLQGYQSLLVEAKPFVPGRTAKKIQDILQHSDSGYISNDVSSGSSFKDESAKDGTGEEVSRASSSVGSLEALDEVEYDVNSTDQSRATGNIGKSSEITWMQGLEKDAVRPNNSQGGEFGFDDSYRGNVPSHRPYPHELNYHLDDLEISVSEPVQVYYVPPRQLADTLFGLYLRVVHPYLPIINSPLFCNQYLNFYDNSAIPGDKWLAILNMVFAIAATYAQKAEMEWPGDPQDHLHYLTRARILSMNGDDVFRHSDLQQVQVEGLVSLYLLSTDQIHRSWRISALAIRSAISLGLNLRNNDRTVTSLSKEVRNRLWWSLFIIENRLSLMTGRPSCVSVNMCSAPFPLPLSDEQLQTSTATTLLDDPRLRDKRLNNVMASSRLQPTSSGRPIEEEDFAESHTWLSSLPVTAELCFLYACDLTMLMEEISGRIYSVHSVHHTGQHIQAHINELKSRLDTWFTSIPISLDFAHITENDEAKDEKTRLACQYYSAKMMLGRPCLCTPHKNRFNSDEEKGFAHLMAVSTIKSASQMAQLIPEVSSSAETFGISPWWCCLHYVMQTAAVLIIELSLNCIHMAEQKSSLLQLTKRCILWLHKASKQRV
ncbi:unnamed protein product [Penicillium pancosmium]